MRITHDASICGSGAHFSNDRQYRYALWRKWDIIQPSMLFIGLNPSTANETQNDPTIRRVVSFAKEFGYGGIYMCNLFGIVSTDPKLLLSPTVDPIGDNDWALKQYAEFCKDVVFGWGAFKEAKVRAAKVIDLFPEAYCLGITKDGSPKHPLYLAGDTHMWKFNSLTPKK